MLLSELKHAVRNLRRAPRFTLTCAFTLALALAGTTTLLNVLEAYVFRKLAVSAPEQLVGLFPTRGDQSAGFSLSALETLRARQQALTGICGVTAGYGALNVQIGAGPVRQRPVEAVSGGCYGLLGVTPSIGRAITTEDEPAASAPARVVVISDRLWREQFGASPDVLGQTLRLEGTPLTIVGVLPATYRGLNADEAPDVAVPLTLPWALKLHPPLAMHAVGRLRPGVGIGEAAAELTAIWPEVSQAATEANPARPETHLRVVPLAGGFSILRERYRTLLYALVALAGCLLLLASVNVGGLSLARLLDRRGVLAVQFALGAGRARLALQLVWEGLLIAVMATLMALPIARWGAAIAGHALWPGDRPFTIEVTAPATSLLVMGMAAVVAALLVCAPGLIALVSQSWDVGARTVRHTARGGGQRLLVATQIALCVVLACGAALFASHLHALGQLPLGYDPPGLQWARLDRASRAASAPTLGYGETLLERITALPGVEGAALSTSFGTVDLWDVADRITVSTPGYISYSVRTATDRISPDFFRTASIPLHQGREFTWSDVRSRAPVAIVNRSLVHQLLSSGHAVGETVNLEGRGEVTIVGVVADATPGDPRIQEAPRLYLPLGPQLPAAPVLLVRDRTGSLTEASLRGIVEPFGRHQVVRFGSMHDQVDRFLAQERLITFTSSLFALLALVVSITGLYAALSQNVSCRTREIGVRMAVGATPSAVRSLVLFEAGRIILIGVGLGVSVAIVGWQVARVLVSELPPDTTLVLAFTVVGIAGVAALVSAWPAQRAARTDVARALRAE